MAVKEGCSDQQQITCNSSLSNWERVHFNKNMNWSQLLHSLSDHTQWMQVIVVWPLNTYWIESRNRHVNVNNFRKHFFIKFLQIASYLVYIRLAYFVNCDTFEEFSSFWDHAWISYNSKVFMFSEHFYLFIVSLLFHTTASNHFKKKILRH